jgi:RNA polymerase sigma factor (sigma-70 family)
MSDIISDEALIRQALAGRQSAYAMLVKRYEQFVFTLTMRVVKNREDAFEVAQDAFLRAFRYLPEFRGDAKFTTWLYKIVYTTALNHVRKNNPGMLSIHDADFPLNLPDTGAPDASAAMELRDRQKSVHEAIKHLSPDDSTIITLFYLYEHSLDEICQIMNLTMTNAKTKLSRARQRLKLIMEERYSELSL